ncbi:bacteriohopanetetrol glucosamine biosynthesis glycosyltransferase HpnI [Massilia putida]|uniref:bacteriohopanetetrol glucosamine biosynthesis glycosyltransferase HpnI n=1 Tax=Massilia putida TaxID=1141883 RepID=UPI0009524739|nr:bacteriohopanetetrol glucosamine biosynthesis glycosyltransferase HpnI [Massilia putida]
MAPALPSFAAIAGTALTLLAALYALAALLCRGRPARGPENTRAPTPVTVLKPLCGAEPRLEDNLAGLCTQTHPCYQLVFGVRAPDDPAIAVVARLAHRFPNVDMRLVVDPRVHGSNRKVSNLINMIGAARHPWLVLADSDIAVEPDYLARVTAPLALPDVGIVTCLYHGRPADGFWSRIGALFIDTWFAPSVRVASSGGGSAFAFGATIAVRASTLRAIGGVEVLKNRLADDYRLGELTRGLGLRTVLSDVCVATDVTEDSLRALWARERRWMQTIRSLNPLGYACTFITFTLPMLALGVSLAPTAWNAALALAGGAARLGLHWRQPAPGVPAPGHARHALLRDCLLLAAWLSGFTGTTARWRGHRLPIDTGRAPADATTESPSRRQRSWTPRR